MSIIERQRFSCMLGGAADAVAAMPGAVPIIHGAAGCGGNLFMASYGGSGYCGGGRFGGNGVPTSALTENDIVFGGIERLETRLRSAIELLDAEIFVVLTACMTEIIGDDVDGAVGRFQGCGKTVFAVSAPGFAGNSYAGYEAALGGLFKRYIKPSPADCRHVNLLGAVPFHDPFFRGDLEEIRRLLESIGLTATTFFTADQTLDDLKKAGSASLNIVLSPAYGVALAAELAESHGIPYIVSELPVGAEASAEFLRKVAERLGIEGAEAVIAREADRYYNYVDRALDLIADTDFMQQYGIVVANANAALPYARYMRRELGWLPRYAFVTDSLNERQREAVEAAFAEAGMEGLALVFETGTTAVRKRVALDNPPLLPERYGDRLSPAYILGSSMEKELAAQLGAKLLTASFPITNRLVVNRGYAGYNGGLNLLEDIITQFVSVR
ncbi:MAG: hypothetical protein LBG71_04035 [Clostridiales Family XIII bacterium]|jgi:nitrogenase molybdenum-iron protein beta chain|nr:hypothetical protein [Clostridiales Family XIII bacterium]